LRAGDEAAFKSLVSSYHNRLVRFAETIAPTRAIAEEIVQDTWVAVVKGVARFEGRSSVKTWLFRIVANRARTASAREARTVPIGGDHELDRRFDRSGAWSDPPAPWSEEVDNRVVAREVAGRVKALLPALPVGQRQVVVLRDLDGVDAADVCGLLGISAANQRVLLHRGRARLRSLLETEMGRR
jgi:RNA polymerase sigma-70 factor (ECF subfamily)